MFVMIFEQVFYFVVCCVPLVLVVEYCHCVVDGDAFLFDS